MSDCDRPVPVQCARIHFPGRTPPEREPRLAAVEDVSGPDVRALTTDAEGLLIRSPTRRS